MCKNKECSKCGLGNSVKNSTLCKSCYNDMQRLSYKKRNAPGYIPKKERLKNATKQRCKKCKIVKPLSAFHKNKKLILGVISKCRDCFSKDNNVTQRNTAHYVNNRELYYEIIVSKARGKLTKSAQDMLIKIGDGVISKFTYKQPNDKYDCYAYGLECMLRNFHNFDERKTTNPFAYFTEIFKRGIAMEWNKIYKERKENIIIVSLDGMNNGDGAFNL